jgi:hypothetical protein
MHRSTRPFVRSANQRRSPFPCNRPRDRLPRSAREITDAAARLHRGLGVAAALPFVARAQQGDRVRRVGVLMPGDENDPVGRIRDIFFIKRDHSWKSLTNRLIG